MKRILIIVLFVITQSLICSSQSFSKYRPKKSRLIPETFNLKQTVSEIISYGVVDAPMVGYRGMKSEQYSRFVSLKVNISDSELVLLTKHQDPIIKAYAFWALTDKEFSGIKQIIVDHLNDIQTFQFRSGCIGERRRINKWFLDLGKNFLTAEEFANYQKALAK
jgi:hypothetical protein